MLLQKKKQQQQEKTVIRWFSNKCYYTTKTVRGPVTKIDQSECSISGSIFSKYWTRHCPEGSCQSSHNTSHVINLLLAKPAQDYTWRISALGLSVKTLGQYSPSTARSHWVNDIYQKEIIFFVRVFPLPKG